ncbi:chemotaxis protein CheX [Amphibacillus sediminis]|uniref:chemotaxis protein CheX n=1 Tax=Amphibacillus sediminis TaxID=360185 RepID=UPI000829D7CB|nr:chemotaxis protein CheX [Amphibacillus sediminis]
MVVEEKSINEIIKDVYNGTIDTVKKTIPLEPAIGAPAIIEPPLEVAFGVLIGFTGDIKGELVLQADDQFFATVGESMFGMPVTGDMLESFAGELGNMIAGGLATYLATQSIKTDITHPTVLKGDAALSGFKRALFVDVSYTDQQKLAIHLLLNK